MKIQKRLGRNFKNTSKSWVRQARWVCDFVDKNFTLLRVHRANFSILIGFTQFSLSNKVNLLFNKCFPFIVISVQEVSKESQELMRKALEEVCSAFCCCCCCVLFMLLSFSWLVEVGATKRGARGWRNLNVRMKETHELVGSSSNCHCCFHFTG